MTKEMEEKFRELGMTEDDVKHIAYQCAVDRFTECLREAEDTADIEGAEHYYNIVTLYKQMIDEVKYTRLLPLEEVLTTSGTGWFECWYPGDEEEGLKEEFTLTQCSWCKGNVIFEDGDFCDRNDLCKRYRKQYGHRIWSKKPAEWLQFSETWEAGEE